MKTKIVAGLVIVFGWAVTSSFAQELEFTFTTTPQNIVASKAVIDKIDKPGFAGNPNAIIVATPLGDTESLNPHPIGAWYYNDKWNIFNTDHATMPPGAVYRLQVFPGAGPNQLLHIISKQNLSGEGSYINHPLLNNRPDAQFKILQNHAPYSRAGNNLNAFEAKAVFNSTSGKWYIANVNAQRLNLNTAYNIVIFPHAPSGPTDPALTPRPVPIATRTRMPIVTTSTPTAVPTRTREPIPPATTQPIVPTPTPQFLPASMAVASAQPPCTGETAYQTVGKWGIQRKDDVGAADPSFPKEQYKPVLAKAQKVVDLFKLASPEFKGIQAYAHRFIQGESYVPNGPLPFRLNVVYQGYSCIRMDNSMVKARGKVILLGGYGSTLVHFNSFGNMLEKSLLTTGNQQIYWFRKQLGEFKGFTMIEPREGDGEKHEGLIIAPDKRLPYIPVTREQYLRALQAFSRTKIKERQGTLPQVDAEIAKRIAAIDANPNLSPQLKEQIKTGLVAHGKELDASLPNAMKSDEGKIAKIEAELARLSAAERQSPAIVGDLSGWEGTAKLFVTDAEGGWHLVTIDKSFFDPKLPRDAVQFIAVDWSWNDKDTPKVEAIRQFKEKFDFEALRQMLGK